MVGGRCFVVASERGWQQLADVPVSCGVLNSGGTLVRSSLRRESETRTADTTAAVAVVVQSQSRGEWIRDTGGGGRVAGRPTGVTNADGCGGEGGNRVRKSEETRARQRSLKLQQVPSSVCVCVSESARACLCACACVSTVNV